MAATKKDMHVLEINAMGVGKFKQKLNDNL